MNKIIKGILIDTKNRQIKEVEVETANFLEQCYKLIGCSLIEGVGFDGKHDLYVDEEGLFNQELDFFTIEGYEQPLRGNGLIFGFDIETFENCSHTTSVEEVSVNVLFADKEVVYSLI